MDDITRYRKCGWDFDQVLWEHEHSRLFWNYILTNPHQQEHFIITFRTGRLFDRIWYDLGRANCPLLAFHFRGVFGVPEQVYNDFVLGLVGGDRYLFWKGEQCAELGIELLIDDATMEVFAGCSRYGIDYLHPDQISTESLTAIPR